MNNPGRGNGPLDLPGAPSTADPKPSDASAAAAALAPLPGAPEPPADSQPPADPLATMGRFAEEGLAALPDSWQQRCLNYPALKELLQASARGVPLPLVNGPSGLHRPKATPSLLPNLQADERHRRFAELLIRELDAAFSFLLDERIRCANDLSNLENLATKYRKTTRGASATAGAAAAALEPGEEDQVPLSSFGDDSGDPYLRAKLKEGLCALHADQAQHVVYRMLTHDVCQRLVVLQTQLIADEDSTTVSGDAEAMASTTTAKELMLFVMGHAFFTELGAKAMGEDVTQLYAALFCHGDTVSARLSLRSRSASSLPRCQIYHAPLPVPVVATNSGCPVLASLLRVLHST